MALDRGDEREIRRYLDRAQDRIRDAQRNLDRDQNLGEMADDAGRAIDELRQAEALINRLDD